MKQDPDLAPSVRFCGRCVAALAMDPRIMDRGGGVYTVSELAGVYGFTDPDRG